MLSTVVAVKQDSKWYAKRVAIIVVANTLELFAHAGVKADNFKIIKRVVAMIITL